MIGFDVAILATFAGELVSVVSASTSRLGLSHCPDAPLNFLHSGAQSSKHLDSEDLAQQDTHHNHGLQTAHSVLSAS